MRGDGGATNDQLGQGPPEHKEIDGRLTRVNESARCGADPAKALRLVEADGTVVIRDDDVELDAVVTTRGGPRSLTRSACGKTVRTLEVRRRRTRCLRDRA